MFKLEIKTSNSAYKGEKVWTELMANLDQVKTRLNNGESEGRILDTNGKTVGDYGFEMV